MAARERDFAMWTVYKHPKDWPHHYVARRFVIKNGQSIATDTALYARTFIKLRRALENRMGLTRINRDPKDEPQIVGVWL